MSVKHSKSEANFVKLQFLRNSGRDPVKERRGILPDSERRPADIFIPNWAGGKDAALDITVIHPLQGATRRGAAANPGHALTIVYKRKMREAGKLC